MAYSTAPKIGGFGFNAQPPANLTQYALYITALAEAAAARFGLAAVQSWKWGVLTEYNNQDWLVANASTFFDLYDYTACALERALGSGAVDIGAHACTQCHGPTDWDSLGLLDHVSGGANACTGGVGAPMTFFSLSFYEVEVGQPGDLGWVARDILPAVSRAATLGLNISFGIDEGRLLQGIDKLPLATRAVGDTYQASWDALFSKALIAGGVGYYSRWTLNTGGGAASGVGQVDPVSTNVARLLSRMAGGKLLPSTNTTAASSRGGSAPSSIVDGLVAFDSASSTLRAILFRHHVNASDGGADTASLRVCGWTPPALPLQTAVPGTAWRVDDSHGQFWGAFQADVARYNLTSFQPGWSASGEVVTLTNATERAIFASRVPAYQQLARLIPEPADALLDAQGCLTFDAVLAGHAVLLGEWPGLTQS